MKYIFTGLFLLVFGGACATNQEPSNITNDSAASKTNSDKSAIEIVNLRMQSYNDHNIDKFMSAYSENVKIYTYPDKELATGKPHIKSIFEPMFKEKNVGVKIHHQIAKDSYVINHETVTVDGKDTEYVSIYEVRNGLITSVRFVRD